MFPMTFMLSAAPTNTTMILIVYVDSAEISDQVEWVE